MTGGIRIRDAREGDVAELARIYAASVETLGPEHYDDDAVAAWSAFAATPAFRTFVLGPRTLVAEDASGILGFAGLEPSGRVASLYVRPDRARLGIGSVLLRALLELGEAQAVRTFRTEASELSRRLFERYGFAVVEREIVDREGARIVRFRMVRTEGADPGGGVPPDRLPPG